MIVQCFYVASCAAVCRNNRLHVCLWPPAAAAQRQESSMTSLLEVAATASCRRSSFSGQLHLPLSSSSAAVCRQTTFRPVVAATPVVRSGLRKSSAAVRLVDASWSPWPSDDESCNLATRKRRHDDDSSDDALTSSAASDDDEEVKTIFSDELTMTSWAPGNGVEKRNWSLPPRRATTTAAAVNDCSVVHRPSLNLYKMQVSAVLTYVVMRTLRVLI